MSDVDTFMWFPAKKCAQEAHGEVGARAAAAGAAAAAAAATAGLRGGSP